MKAWESSPSVPSERLLLVSFAKLMENDFRRDISYLVVWLT